MNELAHTANAALNVLHYVQLSLERIRTGEGSAMLLPTIADQLADAQKIISMEIEGAKRLAANRQAQAEAEQERVDLEASMRRRQIETLADQLATEFGPCGLSRPELVAWLGRQVERVKRIGLTGATAAAMVDADYLAMIEAN